jgi:hypothetical protein
MRREQHRAYDRIMTTSRLEPATQRALIASLRYAEINIGSKAKLFAREPEDDPGLLRIEATVTIYDFADDEPSEDEPARISSVEGSALSAVKLSSGDRKLTILRAEGLVLDLYRTEEPYETLDACSEELLAYTCLLDNEGQGLHPDLIQMLCLPVGALAIAERVRIAPAWRGLGGVGRYLAARLFPWMFPDAAVVAAQPFPLDVPRDEHGTADKEALGPALMQIQRTWESIGFQPYKNDIWIMDPNAATHENAASELEEKLQRLFPEFPQ